MSSALMFGPLKLRLIDLKSAPQKLFKEYLLSGTAPNVWGGGGVDWLIVSWIKVIRERKAVAATRILNLHLFFLENHLFLFDNKAALTEFR